MALQYSVPVRNARVDAVEATVGTSPILEIRSGPPPANPAAAASGIVLVTINLPADWLGNPANGTKSKLGTWEDTSVDASGRAGHYRIWDSGKANCHIQGIAAGPWRGGIAYAVGDVITNDSGKLYRATAAGTSAASGGPTGTGAGITDGSVTWAYAQAAPEMSLDSADFTAGQDFIVSGFTITSGNA